MGRRLVAWSLWLATVGNLVAGLVVALALVRPLTLAVVADWAAGVVFLLSLATIGLVLTLRRPANPIGWLYASAAVVSTLGEPWSYWAGQLLRDGRPLPLAAQVAVVARDLDWAPIVALGITLPFLLLPDGRLRSPRWRVVAAAAIVAAVMMPLAGGLAPGRLVQTPIANPFELHGTPGVAASVAAIVSVVLYWASLLAALVCVVLRFRDAGGVERQQLRWVAAGATAAVIGLVLTTLVVQGMLPGAAAVVAYPAVLCMPVSVAVAILRYRLYDLDHLISRSVVYGLLTAAGIAVYAGVVRLADWLLREGVGIGGGLVATAVVAVGFAPARERLQRWVDRRLYGERHDPVAAVAQLGDRLRDGPAGAAGGDVLAGVLRGVCGTLRLPWGRLRLGNGAELASFGRPGTAGATIPLDHEGDRIGELVVGLRSGEQTLGEADRRVLEILAAPVAVAVHAVLLSQELQRSRRRMVAAREDERRRLRRDLHDGLGPVLTAVTLKADAARGALDTAPDRADALLAELRGDARRAIDDLRRTVDALRPSSSTHA